MASAVDAARLAWPTCPYTDTDPAADSDADSNVGTDEPVIATLMKRLA